MPRFADWSRFVSIFWLAFSCAAEAPPFEGGLHGVCTPRERKMAGTQSQHVRGAEAREGR
jgi:hypothetical protein